MKQERITTAQSYREKLACSKDALKAKRPFQYYVFNLDLNNTTFFVHQIRSDIVVKSENLPRVAYSSKLGTRLVGEA